MLDKRIGITTTVPVEVIFAAGLQPVDINNLFIAAPKPQKYIEVAEQIGYPRTSCSWIKGLYGATLEYDIKRLIAVMVGDCSYTHSLMETLKLQQVELLTFAYPYDRDRKALKHEIVKLAIALGTTMEQVDCVWRELKDIRAKVSYLDKLTWQELKVTGFENHLWQVSCSDFNGDYKQFAIDLDEFILEVENRPSKNARLRLGYIGVPPIMTDIYDLLELADAKVVFNEVQRQFVMPNCSSDITDQYLDYTYPYDPHMRWLDIEREIEQRELDGIIHYTQSFCHRQVDDIIFRKYCKIPILTLEADKPGIVDARNRMRVDAYLDMLKGKKKPMTNNYNNLHVSNLSNNLSNNSYNELDQKITKKTCGIDLGSRSVKIAILDGEDIVDLKSIDTIDFYRNYGIKTDNSFRVDYQKLILADVDKVVSTGYGKNTLHLAGATQIPELEAHTRGAVFQTELADFVLLDLGGQDSKVIEVRSGKLFDFVTNDKCAASSGRYLENMAVILGLSIEQLAQYYAEPLELNSTCAVFAESELIGHIASGINDQVLAASVNYSIVRRIEPLLQKFTRRQLVFTGGVAKNKAIVELLQVKMGNSIIVPNHPEFNGAIGAARYAADINNERKEVRDSASRHSQQ